MFADLRDCRMMMPTGRKMRIQKRRWMEIPPENRDGRKRQDCDGKDETVTEKERMDGKDETGREN